MPANGLSVDFELWATAWAPAWGSTARNAAGVLSHMMWLLHVQVHVALGEDEQSMKIAWRTQGDR